MENENDFIWPFDVADVSQENSFRGVATECHPYNGVEKLFLRDGNMMKGSTTFKFALSSSTPTNQPGWESAGLLFPTMWLIDAATRQLKRQVGKKEKRNVDFPSSRHVLAAQFSIRVELSSLLITVRILSPLAIPDTSFVNLCRP